MTTVRLTTSRAIAVMIGEATHAIVPTVSGDPDLIAAPVARPMTLVVLPLVAAMALAGIASETIAAASVDRDAPREGVRLVMTLSVAVPAGLIVRAGPAVRAEPIARPGRAGTHAMAAHAGRGATVRGRRRAVTAPAAEPVGHALRAAADTTPLTGVHRAISPRTCVRFARGTTTPRCRTRSRPVIFTRAPAMN
ncbi:hypothetical protein GCM10009796_02800 [Microbacterium koreense]